MARTVDDHKAVSINLLHVTPHCSYADYFLILSATSTRHASALADVLIEEYGDPVGMEGYTSGEWVLLDFGEVVVHIFYEPVRYYYNLDKLWIHAPSLRLAPSESRATAGPMAPAAR